jgi:hypothetical protein
MADFSFSDFGQSAGNAVSDLFSGIGAQQAAGSYRTSAKYAKKNAQLEAESLAIKQAQLKRNLFSVIGGQKADVAAAGFSQSGSAVDILRDSASQGALLKAQTDIQGDIAISSYRGQAEAASQQARAEDTAATGNFIGTAISTVATLAPLLLLSDRRAKHSIYQIGWATNGLPWYKFCYLGSREIHEGLMSDDVRAFRPEAVVVGADGFDRVNYELALS